VLQCVLHCVLQCLQFVAVLFLMASSTLLFTCFCVSVRSRVLQCIAVRFLMASLTLLCRCFQKKKFSCHFQKNVFTQFHFPACCYCWYVQPIAERVPKNLELFLNKFNQPKFCPWDLWLVPGNDVVLMINPIRILVRLGTKLKVRRKFGHPICPRLYIHIYMLTYIHTFSDPFVQLLSKRKIMMFILKSETKHKYVLFCNVFFE